jgi:hypothetical protein
VKLTKQRGVVLINHRDKPTSVMACEIDLNNQRTVSVSWMHEVARSEAWLHSSMQHITAKTCRGGSQTNISTRPTSREGHLGNVELGCRLHLVPGLRMGGEIPPLPHTPSCCCVK